jgi:hypothetical protein
VTPSLALSSSEREKLERFERRDNWRTDLWENTTLSSTQKLVIEAILLEIECYRPAADGYTLVRLKRVATRIGMNSKSVGRVLGIEQDDLRKAQREKQRAGLTLVEAGVFLRKPTKPEQTEDGRYDTPVWLRRTALVLDHPRQIDCQRAHGGTRTCPTCGGEIFITTTTCTDCGTVTTHITTPPSQRKVKSKRVHIGLSTSRRRSRLVE